MKPLNVKKKLNSLNNFLFKKHKVLSIAIITGIICTAFSTIVTTKILSNNFINKEYQLKANYSSANLSSVSDFSYNNNSLANSSSQISSINSIPSSSPQQPNVTVSSNNSQSQNIQNSQSNQNTQNTVSPQYIITVKHNIETYQSDIQQDQQNLAEKQKILQETEDNKNVMLLTNSKPVAIADPEKVKEAQDEVNQAQTNLQDDQNELKYWQDIANSYGIK